MPQNEATHRMEVEMTFDDAKRWQALGEPGPGALGDAVILDRDPFDADWDTAPPVVVTTIVGGKVAYDGRPGSGRPAGKILAHG